MILRCIPAAATTSLLCKISLLVLLLVVLLLAASHHCRVSISIEVNGDLDELAVVVRWLLLEGGRVCHFVLN